MVIKWTIKRAIPWHVQFVITLEIGRQTTSNYMRLMKVTSN